MRLLLIISLISFPVWVADSNGLLLVAPGMRISGIDVSHHQKQIEWDSVAQKEHIHFAFVKATEGSDYTDSLFCQNWESLRRLQIRRGAYHFFRLTTCGDTQADNFLRTVELRAGDLPPVLDVETLDYETGDALVAEMKIWLSIVERSIGTKPIIYTNQKFYERYLSGRGFDNYPLWIARYSVNHPDLADGRTWTFWQQSNEGCVEGISEKVDLNVFPGTPEMLGQLALQPGQTKCLP